jgi:nucleotide-binding universal stress UspA family protein
MTLPAKKVLACVDRSSFAPMVTDYAAWAAQRMQAPLELLHVIDRHLERSSGEDHSGAIGFNAQESLLTQLSEAEAHKAKRLREEGRLFLNTLREKALRHGLDTVDMRQRHGSLAATLAEQENNIRLFVLGRQGHSAAESESTQGLKARLGSQVEHVVRTLKCPILTVNQAFSTPQQIMLAYDGTAATRKGVEMMAQSPLFRGLPLHVIMAGAAEKETPKKLEWAVSTLTHAGFEVQSAFIPGEPHAIIRAEIKARNIDMLLMGAYTHSPLRALILGSRTSALLRAIDIPCLLMRW